MKAALPFPHYWPFVRGIHRWMVTGGPVTRKNLPIDDVIMTATHLEIWSRIDFTNYTSTYQKRSPSNGCWATYSIVKRQHKSSALSVSRGLYWNVLQLFGIRMTSVKMPIIGNFLLWFIYCTHSIFFVSKVCIAIYPDILSQVYRAPFTNMV